MEAYLKRYFWVLHVVLIIAIGALAAAAVNNVVAGFLSPLSVSAPPAPSLDGVDKGDKQGVGSVAGVSNPAFDPPEKPEDEDKKPEEEAPEEEAPLELALEGEYPTSSLEVSLTGTLVAGDPSWSMAMLVDKGSKGSFSVKTGEMFMDSAKLVTVERERIIIENGGQLEQIEIEGEQGPERQGGAPVTKNRFSSAPKAAPPALNTSLNTAIKPAKGDDQLSDFRKGITKSGNNNFSIDRGVLKKALENPKMFQDGARVLPNYSSGRINGFKVSGLKSGSIFSDLGVQSGDVITQVNGKPLNSPNEALKLYQKLGSAGDISIQVERGGKPVDLKFNIK